MNPAFFALMIPILALMIPIVAILVHHQQKMAEIMHRTRAAQPSAEIDALRNEVKELKELIHQQAIAVDNLVNHQTRSSTPPNTQDRISSGLG